MKKLIALLLIILSVTLIVIGIADKQNNSVLQKAKVICMECVGIG